MHSVMNFGNTLFPHNKGTLLMPSQKFTGDKKAPMHSPLAKVERQFIDAWIPRFPPWIEGYHLTLLTIPWSVGLILFGWLATYNIHWLWGSSFMLFLQWFTDSFDGSLGRYRDTGIPKWGFHMDHLLDFIFMSAVFIGYAFLMREPHSVHLMLIIGFIYAVLMVNSFLEFGAIGEFRITWLGTGPTELRLYFIIINCFLMGYGIGWLERMLPYLVGAFIASATYIVYMTQRRIWEIDMEVKRAKMAESQAQETVIGEAVEPL
jgi:archaetidylinositol phosphate synthase